LRVEENQKSMLSAKKLVIEKKIDKILTIKEWTKESKEIDTEDIISITKA